MGKQITGMRTGGRACLIHIGTEKTGTTSIQEFLKRNRDALSSCDIFLPEILGTPNNRDFVAYFQDYLDDFAKVRGLSSVEEVKRFLKPSVDELVTWLNKLPRESLTVFTSEHFSSRLRTKKEIRRLKSFLSAYFDQIDIICFFRPQADVGLSRYTTAIQFGSSQTLDEFLRGVVPSSSFYDYTKLARRWTSVFGSEHFIALEFKKDHENQSFDVIPEFVSALEMFSPELKLVRTTPPSRSNASYSSLLAAALRVTNTRLPFWTDNKLQPVNAKNIAIRKKLQQLESLKKGKLHSVEVNEIRKRFSQTNERFVKKYLGPDSLDAFLGVAGNDEQPISSFDIREVVLLVEELTDALLGFVEPDQSSPVENTESKILTEIARTLVAGELPPRSSVITLLRIAQLASPPNPELDQLMDELWGKLGP